MQANEATRIAADPQIFALDDASFHDWNRYVEATTAATFYHRAEWRRILETVFGLETHYLLAKRDGTICGVLPLARVRSMLFGDALISTPFCVYGGIVANDVPTRDALGDAAFALARERQVGHIELRQLHGAGPDWPRRDGYCTFSKFLDVDVEKNFLDVPRKQRAMIRKGISAKLKSREDADIDVFYRIYATSLRNLGTPVYPRAYLTALKQVFADDCQILTVEENGQPVSSVMSFFFRDQVLPIYAGGLAAARKCHAYDFMYWEVMRQACCRGIRQFDYGRSIVGTGSYHFKKNWGFEPTPLDYRIQLIAARSITDLKPTNPRLALAIATWKHLPLAITNRLGPMFAKGLA